MSLIAVVSGKGSPGATFVAVNLGSALAAVGAAPLLIDLDPHGGDLAGFLGLDPRRGLHPLRLLGDDNYSPQGLLAEVQERSGIACIAGYPRAPDADPALVHEVIAAASATGRLVVADLGRVDARFAPALEPAELVLVVLRSDLVSIHGAERALELLLRSGIERSRLAVVVNAWQWSHAADAAEIAETLGLPSLRMIPLDRRAARRALRRQTPIARGRAARAFRQLSRQVLSHVHSAPAHERVSYR